MGICLHCAQITTADVQAIQITKDMKIINQWIVGGDLQDVDETSMKGQKEEEG